MSASVILWRFKAIDSASLYEGGEGSGGHILALWPHSRPLGPFRHWRAKGMDAGLSDEGAYLPAAYMVVEES